MQSWKLSIEFTWMRAIITFIGCLVLLKEVLKSLFAYPTLPLPFPSLLPFCYIQIPTRSIHHLYTSYHSIITFTLYTNCNKILFSHFYNFFYRPVAKWTKMVFSWRSLWICCPATFANRSLPYRKWDRFAIRW